MTFNPDQSQQWALLTWYPIDSPLHLDARHPAIGLAGEAGELLNLYKKFEYKPGHSFDKEKFILELSDYSYYLRILAYIKGVTFTSLCIEYAEIYQKRYTKDDILKLLNGLMSESSGLLNHFIYDSTIGTGYLRGCTFYFLAILHKLDTPLPVLLDLNYKKLNTETQHGWANATTKSRM